MLPSVMALAISFPSLVKVHVVTALLLPNMSCDSHVTTVNQQFKVDWHTVFVSALDHVKLLLGFVCIPYSQCTACTYIHIDDIV